MYREFLVNIAILLGLNLVIKPFYIFGIDRTIQNTVGAEDYGLYFTLFNFTFILQIINDFGLQNFNNRAISQRQNRLEHYFSNILTVKLLLAILFIFVTLLTAWLIGYEREIWFFIFMLCINHILISTILYFRSNISGLGMYRTDSLVSILDKTLLIVICALLLWGNFMNSPFQIEWFVYAQTLSLSITAFIAFFIVLRQTKWFRPSFNLAFIRTLLSKSFPYALVILLMTLYSRIDAVMIERLLPNGKEEAGIYSAAFRLLDASNMIGFLFAGLLMPMFSRLLADIKEKLQELRELVELSFQMVWAGALTLSIGIFFFQEEIMNLLYDNATPYWGNILGWLMLSFIAMSGNYIFGTLLTANGSMKKMNLLFIVSIVINIVLNTLLIINMKAEGAAIATLVTQFFTLFMQIYLSKTELKIALHKNTLLRIFLFLSGLILTGYFITSYDFSIWEYSFFAFLFIGIILSFLLKLINVKVLLNMLSSKV